MREVRGAALCKATLLLAALLGAAHLSLSSSFAGEAATPSASPNAVVPVGKTSPLNELAISQSNLSALAASRNLVKQPLHRLPTGALTSAPSKSTLETLPKLAQPNVAVEAATATTAATSIFGFVGIYEGDNASVNGYELEPPDQGLAVNNNVAVEINNNILQVFNAATGVPMTGPIATSAFFQAPSGSSLTDTQAFYDPTVQRWILTEIISNNSGGNNLNDIAIAVSETSSATGSYYLYHLRAFSNDLSGCGGLDCFPDYPKAGYDANTFVVDVDLFSNQSDGAYVGVGSYVMPKSLLINGAGFTYDRFVFADDFVVQPSVPAPGEPFVTAANGTEYLMTARGSNTVRIWAVSNTNNIVSTPSSLRANSVDIAVQFFGSDTVPSTQPNVIGPYCKSQGITSAPQLDGGYSAFQATVQKANGSLYGALAFGSVDGSGLDRDVIAWFGLTPSVSSSGVPSATVLAQGYVVPTSGYSLSYPAFGLNSTGTGFMGFTETNQSAGVLGGYPSASIIQFTGTGLTGSILVTGQGNTSDDGFSGCPQPGPGQVGRWGDYGAAVVDAATGVFYTANEMIPNSSIYPRGTFANWGTFITQIVPLSTFTISVSASPAGGGNVCCSGSFPANSVQTVTASADKGYLFTNWTENGAVVSTSAAYSFTLTGNTNLVANFAPMAAHDFNGDGRSDVLWRDTAGDVGLWLMNGTQIIQGGAFSAVPLNWSIVGQRDFDGDGKSDILWRDTVGDVGLWLMNGTQIIQGGAFGAVPLNWSIVGTGDFNGDGKADILWLDNQNNVVIWFMNGTQILETGAVGQLPAGWTVVGSDMKGDIFLRNITSGDLGMWVMNGTQIAQGVDLGPLPLTWSVAGIGDFDGNGSSDILLRDTSGNIQIWLMNGTQVLSATVLGNVPTSWSIAETGDFNGDGKSDVLWVDNVGDVGVWFMNGTAISQSNVFGNVGTAWSVQSLNAD